MLRLLGTCISLVVLALASAAAAGPAAEISTRSNTDAGAALATASRDDILRAQGVTPLWGPETIRRKLPKLFDKAFREASVARHADDIAALTEALIGLGPDVDPAEAADAARAVYTYVDQLVIEYDMGDDGPLAHNTKVNMGLKPRGLCWHWAQDLEVRLKMERYKTLKVFSAIANYNNILLEHSTTLLGVPGGKMADAIVVDPWRHAGKLFWKVARKDTRYNWTPRSEVFAYKLELEKKHARHAGRKKTTHADR